MIYIALMQTVICYLAAIPLGLHLSGNVICAIIGTVPMAIFNTALGLLCGSLLGVKQVGGVCGALLTNLSAWLSGIWFDLSLVGGSFEKIARFLPFVHAVELERTLVRGDFRCAGSHIIVVLLYAASITALAVFCFLRRMKKQ